MVNRMDGQDISGAVGPRIAVVGVGGAGCNVVRSFYESCCPVDTIAINTDKTALHATPADVKLYICRDVLHGEGTSGDSVIGKRCADIHKAEIRDALSGYDAVFVIGGLGGGTGSGAMPVVIDAAQAQSGMTFAIAIDPFSFEGRDKVALEVWNHIRAVCENSIMVENDRMFEIMPDLKITEAFDEVNASIRAHVMKCVETLEEILGPVGRDAERTERKSVHRSGYPIEALTSA